MTAPRIYLGYEALIRHYRLKVPSLRCVYVATAQATETRIVNADGSEHITLPVQRLRDPENLVGQLTFAFERETLNLTVLGALFSLPEVLSEVQAWLTDKPSSEYARMAGHLASWLVEAEFDFTLPVEAPWVRLLDPEQYVVGPEIPDAKFGVVCNVIGDRWLSPLVRRTERLKSLLDEHLATKFSAVLQSIEPEILSRALDYLYRSETRATYGIEQEIPDEARALRFRHLLETAGEPGPLTEELLGEWQSEIVHARSAEFFYRQTQNWLSRSGRLQNIADFIPPPSAFVVPMMDSVARIAAYAANGAMEPVVAATCAAFGFVFVHPFLDGNGRLHRFLLHHLLRQGRFTPRGIVLPISTRMESQIERYSAMLKGYSRPRTELLDYVLDAESLTIHVRSPQPRWLYAYFDATDLCEFVLECCQASIEDLLTEVMYLRAYDATVRDLNAWLDTRHIKLNTLIDVIVQGNGKLSQRKQKLAAGLPPVDVARIEATVSEHFAGYMSRRT